jgi:hypothetical protein
LEKKNHKKIKIKQQKKEDNYASDYKERLELQCIIAKINQLISQVVDGHCNIRKFLTAIGARSRTKSQETTMGVCCTMH